jgi:hypothetical protein
VTIWVVIQAQLLCCLRMRCNRGRGPIAGAPARSIRSFTGQPGRQPVSASRLLEPLYDLLMADDATFSHFFQPLANQRVLVGVQFDVVGNRLVDEITARPVLRGGKGIKRVNLFGIGPEADGFLSGARNTGKISYIIMY